MSTPVDRVKALFLEISSYPPNEHERLLAERCAGDTELLAQVRSLLAHDSKGERVSSKEHDSDGSDDLSQLSSRFEPHEHRPEKIGPYTIAGTLGAGGSSVVYEAEQANPRRRVALKVLQTAAAHPTAIRRFETEARVLGMLKHPAIAQTFDAGVDTTWPGGRVRYIAMELVDGDRITSHIRRRNLSIRERIKLFISVCDAVDHAHRNGVIHRDLKPANILVTDSGQPKILDFGIARLVADHDRGDHTMTGTTMGTLGYMSPEQLGGDPGAVDTRTDVFSLGLVLFELLADRRPFDVDGKSITQVAELVSNTQAPPLGATARELAGDLETIVATALATNPNRRYQSVSTLSDDLRRFLGQRPIVARPASSAYFAMMFAKRHAPAVVAASLALMALFAGLTGSLYWGWTATSREAEKREALEESERVVAFLSSMLGSASPLARGRDVRVVEILEDGIESLEELNASPAARAAVEHAIGISYRELGDITIGGALVRSAYETRLDLFGPDDPRTLESMYEHCVIAQEDPSLLREEGYKIAQRTVAAHQRNYGDDDRRTLEAVATMGVAAVNVGRFVEASELLENACDGLADTLGRAHPVTARWRTIRAFVIRGSDPEQSLAILREATADLEAALGSDHPHSVEALWALAQSLPPGEESISLLERAVDGSVAFQGESGAFTLRATNTLGFVLMQAERYDEAAVTLRRVLNAMADSDEFAESDRRLLTVRDNLARALERAGRLPEAETEARETLRRIANPSSGIPPPADDTRTDAHTRLASILEADGRYKEAADQFLSAARVIATNDEDVIPETAAVMLRRARCLAQAGNRTEAATIHSRVLDLVKADADLATSLELPINELETLLSGEELR